MITLFSMDDCRPFSDYVNSLIKQDDVLTYSFDLYDARCFET